MKKLILTFVLVAFAASASFAQEDMPKRPSVKGFVSNGFWDNWEISVGAGIGTAFTNSGNNGNATDRLGFTGDFSLTKWLHPVVGLRGQLQGGTFKNIDITGEKSYPYLFAHGDVMINLSNWIGGYRTDRAYYAIPYVGFGWMVTNFTDKSQAKNNMGHMKDFAFAYGILNKFRLSQKFDFNIELKGLLVKSNLCPAETNGAYLTGLAATAGFTYRFNTRNFQRGVAGVTEKDIKAYQDAVASGNAALEAANADNARLNNELTAAKAEAATAQNAAMAAKAAADQAVAEAAAANAKNNPLATSVILYDYSMATLSSKEKTRLDLMADLIKNGPKDRVYTIEGHADQQTGTAAGNKKIAEKRAKAVYDYLVKKGVNPDQLNYVGKGNEADIYTVQKANRAAVIR